MYYHLRSATKSYNQTRYNYQNYNYGYNNYGQMDPNMYYQYYYGGMYPYYPMNGYGYSQGGHGRYYDNCKNNVIRGEELILMVTN